MRLHTCRGVRSRAIGGDNHPRHLPKSSHTLCYPGINGLKAHLLVTSPTNCFLLTSEQNLLNTNEKKTKTLTKHLTKGCVRTWGAHATKVTTSVLGAKREVQSFTPSPGQPSRHRNNTRASTKRMATAFIRMFPGVAKHRDKRCGNEQELKAAIGEPEALLHDKSSQLCDSCRSLPINCYHSYSMSRFKTVVISCPTLGSNTKDWWVDDGWLPEAHPDAFSLPLPRKTGGENKMKKILWLR